MGPTIFELWVMETELWVMKIQKPNDPKQPLMFWIIMFVNENEKMEDKFAKG